MLFFPTLVVGIHPPKGFGGDPLAIDGVEESPPKGGARIHPCAHSALDPSVIGDTKFPQDAEGVSSNSKAQDLILDLVAHVIFEIVAETIDLCTMNGNDLGDMDATPDSPSLKRAGVEEVEGEDLVASTTPPK